MNIPSQIVLPVPRVLRARPSVRLMKLVFIVVVVINIMYFSFFHLGKYEALHSITSKIYDDDFGFNRQPTSRLTGEMSSKFKKMINKKFKSVEDNKDRYWLAHTGLTQTQIDIGIKKFLKKDATDESWLKLNKLFYDPRFTLAMYINEMKNQFLAQKEDDKGIDEKGKNKKGKAKEKVDANSLDPITLPFSWADWMDLTALNDDLARPMSDRYTCDYIRKFTNNNPEPGYFCLNNKDINDARVKELGFENRNQLPGFIIHSHSSHDDRPFNDFRILESKSYALTHLPKPFRVILLNGNEKGGTFEFEVDPNDNRRIILSDLVENYLNTNGYNIDEVDDGSILSINHLEDYQRLLEAVNPRYLTEEEDIQGMYKVLRKQTDPRSSRELDLPARLFSYPESMIKDQIYFYEEKNPIKIDHLPRNERAYYQGLKQCSKYNNDNEPTYFKMATIRIDDDRNVDREWGWHYDWRFFNGALNYDRVGWSKSELIVRTNIILDRLLRNWNRFAEEKGIVTWIMHGPLLSWYWDGLMFPFDVDIDIQMPILELARLAKDYNQTLVLEDPTEGYGKYLIDVGTYIHNRGISSKSNHIDARFVDVDSGIYIDITALSKSKANAPEEYTNNALVNIDKEFHDDNVEIYNDRRKHFYTLEQLSPLKYSMIGGVPVYLPLTITDRLVFEYSKGLADYEFHGWYFVPRLNLWIRKEQVAQAFSHLEIINKEGSIDRNKLMERVSKMTDNEALKLLEDDDILVEYYLTKELTDVHAKEKEFLFDQQGRDNNALKEDVSLKENYNKLTSTFKMSKPLRKALWDFEKIERLKHHKESAT